MTDDSWERLSDGLERCWKDSSLGAGPDGLEFHARLDTQLRLLADILWELYGGRPEFSLFLEDVIALALSAFETRSPRLKERDRAQTPESGWFLSERMVGATCYIDLFAGNIPGMHSRIKYLKELGVTYLHVMPFFKTPEKEHDGGYAVSSYREVESALGDMDGMERLAAELEAAGIVLVADFVFNHTSDEHEWARKARSGERRFRDYYRAFDDYADTVRWQSGLRDIFPEHRKGSFTYIDGMDAWVWTSFHSFQWDLNYRNPDVFLAMAGEMLALANRGIGVLRLDAVAFIWKEAGTDCENLPEARAIIKAFQYIARIACPSLLFKSEAIVHPDEIVKYVSPDSCRLSYNPLLMAELWEASATKDARLLSLSLAARHHLPPGCAWVNYVRCHDDIGWTFADGDAAALGIKGGDHRRFLNDFYTGDFPGSFARGTGFQLDPQSGDQRVCGTTASLAGVERALAEGLADDLETAIRRILLLYGIAFSAGGIPLIYLGDELAALNRYGYRDDPGHAGDSRWVHRIPWSDAAYGKRHDQDSATGKVFAGICRLSLQRTTHRIFSVQDLEILESGNSSILAFRKRLDGETLTVIGNFADRAECLAPEAITALMENRCGRDLIRDRDVDCRQELHLAPCDLIWILDEGAR